MCESHGSVATVWCPAHARTSEEISGIIMYHESYRTDTSLKKAHVKGTN